MIEISDGEIKLVINENVRKQDCFIIQPMVPLKTIHPMITIGIIYNRDALKRKIMASLQ